ncbi:MAG: thiol reductant ABC exporter subunit CydC [Pseudomonadota bacterium]
MGAAAILRRLLGLTRPYRAWLLAAVAVACATVLASVALMTIAGWFIAAMAIAGATTGMMNYFLPAAGIRFFAITRTGGRYLERLLSHDATFRLLTGLRLWLFRRLEPLAPAQLEDRRGADLASGLQADVDTLQHAYLRFGSPVAAAIVCSVALIALLAVLHPPTAIAVAVLLVASGGVAPALARRAAAAPGAESVRLRTELRIAVVDLLQGGVDLRAAGATQRHVAAIDDLGGRLAGAQRRVDDCGNLAEAAVGLCAGLALWSATLLGSASVATGGLAPAVAPALALAALAIFEVVTPLPAALQRWGEVAAAARRLLALADLTPAIAAPSEPSPTPRDGSVVFSSVRLHYRPDGPAVLDGLDLAIASGRRVAILGPSGAGKSSIARLLLRLWEYDGEIHLGGHELRRYQPEDLRRLVGLAAQDAQLFNGSIRDNLLMAAPAADEGAMRRALETVELAAFVHDLPDDLDAWVGEGGARLSAGQARRLVLARTMLRDPLVLVLDEPTENLDATTSRRLLASLVAACAGRTAILITHDPAAAAAFAEEIVHLDAGRIGASAVGTL